MLLIRKKTIKTREWQNISVCINENIKDMATQATPTRSILAFYYHINLIEKILYMLIVYYKMGYHTLSSDRANTSRRLDFYIRRFMVLTKFLCMDTLPNSQAFPEVIEFSTC